MQIRRKFLPRVAVAAVMLPLAGTSWAQEVIRQEDPAPASVEESKTVIEKSFTQPAPKETIIFPNLREQLKDTPAFLRDSQIGVNFRSYYLDRNQNPGSHPEAWAAGGAISFTSGWLLDTLQVGAVWYTSQPIHAPDGRDGTLLLTQGQEGYSTLGQIYGKVKIIDDTNFLNLGRTTYDTPYINRNDNRMTPNTFEGYTWTGNEGLGQDMNIRYGGGYITKIKERNSATFNWMSKDAGANVEHGVGVGGALFTYGEFSIGAVDYYSSDVINIAYGETKYTAVDLPFGLQGLLAGQFVKQQSVGDDKLTGRSFSTDQLGLKAEVGLGAAIFTLAYSVAGSGNNLQNPWSGNPIYTGAMVQDVNRAGEQAILGKLSYDWSKLGLTGFTSYVLVAHGWTDAFTAGPKSIDETEVDFDVEWRPPWEALKGLSLRGRYGYIDIDQTTTHTINRETRVILNYNVLAF